MNNKPKADIQEIIFKKEKARINDRLLNSIMITPRLYYQVGQNGISVNIGLNYEVMDLLAHGLTANGMEEKQAREFVRSIADELLSDIAKAAENERKRWYVASEGK